MSPPQRCTSLVPVIRLPDMATGTNNCDYVEDVRWGDYPGLSRWAQSNTWVLTEGWQGAQILRSCDN